MKFCPECTAPLEEKETDGLARLICTSPSCSYTFWDNPIPIAVGLIRLGDEYILARNANWLKGTFSMISGFVEKGETPEETIVRELKEELGLTCDKLDFIGHFKFDLMNQLMIAYHIEASGGVVLNEEIAEFIRVPYQDLKRFDFGHFVLSKAIVLKWLRNDTNISNLQCQHIESEFLGTVQISSNKKEEFIKQYRTALEETKGIKGVVYLFKSLNNMPRLKGFSKILYIGKTKYDVWSRYNVKNDVDTFWGVYRHIVENYGPISIDVYKTTDPNEAEKTFLKQYYDKHHELPPINRQG